MYYLPDTNVLINYFAAQEPDRSLIISLITEDQLALSPLTIAELRPKNSDGEIKQLNELIANSKIFATDVEIGLQAGKHRQEFSNKIKKVYLIDCLIAATCKVNGLTLITNNLKDYPMKDIKILKPS
ncbi:MAG: PilT protein domain protein [Microgenomates group bacterium GW2011_GWA1_48_10]|uniref:PIN domain-containing protein n=1 Tax=Candidatus Gottesmanbacteria bacterium RIFCSPHIGHO2_01_FULL_47_48 TaxID=1798381 RepID=A0A1F6A5U6_9BACT|nr:MAG: PilT protein domain protein [Microgenomates group bacterium GW2011_GWA1_48_10]OGG19657.1 MAG: hypothetical protein A2721_00895 [Candidatus Gottesmanbacteria bacterium RIFCSPHIGHO2_01_FULL_47_48]